MNSNADFYSPAPDFFYYAELYNYFDNGPGLFSPFYGLLTSFMLFISFLLSNFLCWT